jgi:hypothetical protein
VSGSVLLLDVLLVAGHAMKVAVVSPTVTELQIPGGFRIRRDGDEGQLLFPDGVLISAWYWRDTSPSIKSAINRAEGQERAKRRTSSGSADERHPSPHDTTWVPEFNEKQRNA